MYIFSDTLLYVTISICIQNKASYLILSHSMFNLGNFLTKNAITFDQKKTEGKKLYLVGMKFCCASNAATKNIKIARKKINFFFQNIFNKIAILKKIQIFRKHKVYFQILEALPVILTCLGLIIKL